MLVPELCQTIAQGIGSGFGPVGNVGLGVDVAYMSNHRVMADE